MTCKPENECCKLCHWWTWVIDGSHCWSDSKRKRKTFEISAFPVFSRPPPVPHSLWNDHRMDGPWARGLSTPLSRSSAWLSIGKGIRLVLSRAAGATPGCCSHMLTATAPGLPSPQTATRVWPSGSFVLVWFGFLLPWIFGFCSDKGDIISEKEGVEVRDWRKKILRAIG